MISAARASRAQHGGQGDDELAVATFRDLLARAGGGDGCGFLLMSYWGGGESGHAISWPLTVVVLAVGWLTAWAVLGGHLAPWAGGLVVVGLVGLVVAAER